MPKIIYAQTHADFLNQAFGTNYKGFYKSRWSYDKNTWVWMSRMDGQIRDGWKNRIVSSDEIWEEYVWEGTPTYSNEIEKTYRIVVKIVDIPSGREYHILGKYKYDVERSTVKKHILVKVEKI